MYLIKNAFNSYFKCKLDVLALFIQITSMDVNFAFFLMLKISKITVFNLYTFLYLSLILLYNVTKIHFHFFRCLELIIFWEEMERREINFCNISSEFEILNNVRGSQIFSFKKYLSFQLSTLKNFNVSNCSVRKKIL